MDTGFEKGSSDNLPVIDASMIDDYYIDNLQFLSAEMRNIKTQRATRESYGDNAVGYVQLKRIGPICTVKAKISPEHKVRGSQYEVSVEVDEEKQKIVSSNCLSCAASSGGCKHATAFLFWLHRRSEEPAVTSQVCYWRGSEMAKVGRKLKSLNLEAVVGQPIATLKPKGSAFLQKVQNIQGVTGAIFDMSRSLEYENTDVYHISLKYIEERASNARCADDFVQFMQNAMTEAACAKLEKDTCSQAESSAWHENRYARITASRLHEAAKCKVLQGSLVETILGGSSFIPTTAVQRGRRLEKEVIIQVAKQEKLKIDEAGLFVSNKYPMFGASPDGITDAYVIEVKCPIKEKTVERYVKNGIVTPKYVAQVQLQMCLAKKNAALFCVASPNFEQNKTVYIYKINYDNDICVTLMNDATQFWKDAIYPSLIK